MISYISAYDLESIETPISAVETITNLHKKYDAPATFFIVGQLLEQHPEKYKDILNGELFDIESHTYSHKLFKDNLTCGKSVSLERIDEEITRANAIIKATFNKKVLGLRTPVGFHRGLQGEKKVLRLLWKNGIRFVSSHLMGFFDSVPSPLTQPYCYEEEGFPELFELPGHDWHDNVLKGYSQVPVMWPPIFPWGIPRRTPKTPQEEFKVYKASIDYAIKNNLTYYSPIFHPWSIFRFNQKAKTVDLLLDYVRRRKMRMGTYCEMYETLKKEGILGEKNID